MEQNRTEIKNITIPCIITILGSPNSGKSYLLKYIMKMHRKKFKWGLAFTKTKFTGGLDYVPQRYIRSRYDETVLSTFIKEQERTKATWPAFLIFDDMLDANIFKSDLFQSVIYAFRHLNITLIITSQYAYKLNSPLLRECTVYSAIFKQRTQKSTRATYELAGLNAENYDEWAAMLSKLGDHEFVWADFDKKSGEPYTTLKAPPQIGNFTLVFGERLKKAKKKPE